MLLESCMLTSSYEVQEFQAVARVEAHVRKASCGHDAKVEFGHNGLRVEPAPLDERKQAYANTVTPDCREKCAGCGANCLLKEVGCDA